MIEYTLVFMSACLLRPKIPTSIISHALQSARLHSLQDRSDKATETQTPHQNRNTMKSKPQSTHEHEATFKQPFTFISLF